MWDIWRNTISCLLFDSMIFHTAAGNRFWYMINMSMILDNTQRNDPNIRLDRRHRSRNGVSSFRRSPPIKVAIHPQMMISKIPCTPPIHPVRPIWRKSVTNVSIPEMMRKRRVIDTRTDRIGITFSSHYISSFPSFSHRHGAPLHQSTLLLLHPYPDS